MNTLAQNSHNDYASRLFDLFAGAETHHGTYDHLQVVAPEPGEKVEIKKSARTVKSGPTLVLWQRQLAGEYPLGVSPHRANDTCVWGVIDVDQYSDLSHAGLFERIEREKLPLVVCRSKSGGAHLFLFMAEPAPTASMRDTLEAIVKRLNLPSKTEVFPKQKKASEVDSTSWLNMPYFGGDESDRYAVKKGGLGMSLAEFLRVAECKKSALTALVDLATLRSKAASAMPAAAAAPTVAEFEQWFADNLPKLKRAVPKDADNCLFRLARDVGRWAHDVDIDEDEAERRTRSAWHQRGKSDDDFDQPWRYNLAKGKRLGDPPRVGESRVLPVSRRLSEFTIAPVEWLWTGRIAVGKLSIIAGHPGLGKSQLTMHIAAKVTTGGEWPFDEGVARQGRVLVLSAEDDPADTILPRLLAAGGDPASVTVLEAVRAKDGELRSEHGHRRSGPRARRR
ncbi:AAA family ATPase [Mesorhizobium sp.]|uniref:AAA family ATPase n=1 Tax=Mesorhizobium sp. TaxID=1871066 RepID=UPI001227548C|nr:AAA family ATPase [Mesorhizobium sp.]TIM48781.1 MAG: hypothetical protein E5Y56_06150 [Mesorhizobium sp.]